jgi:hypothetical protein
MIITSYIKIILIQRKMVFIYFISKFTDNNYFIQVIHDKEVDKFKSCVDKQNCKEIFLNLVKEFKNIKPVTSGSMDELYFLNVKSTNWG